MSMAPLAVAVCPCPGIVLGTRWSSVSLTPGAMLDWKHPAPHLWEWRIVAGIAVSRYLALQGSTVHDR